MGNSSRFSTSSTPAASHPSHCLLAVTTFTSLLVILVMSVQLVTLSSRVNTLEQSLLVKDNCAMGHVHNGKVVHRSKRSNQHDASQAMEANEFDSKRTQPVTGEDDIPRNRTANTQRVPYAGEAAHFSSSVLQPDGIHTWNRSQTYDIHAQGQIIGKLSKDGYTPGNDNIYRMFQLNRTMTGAADTQFISYEKGDTHAIVQKEGLYQIYAHITYWVKSVTVGYAINLNGTAVLRCVTSQRVNSPLPNQLTQAPTPCSTTSVLYLRPGDRISIQCLYRRRHILYHGWYTFWGLVRFPLF